MPIDKEKIKLELINESNTILNNWNEPYEVDTISVMNMQGKVTLTQIFSI